MGARVYDPGSGRFLSRDTWGIAGGDTDLYRYALGAPTVYTDPSGHVSECVGMALGWAMSTLGPGGGWDDYDALDDKVRSGELSPDQWTVAADQVAHDVWSGFDVVASVCGTSAVGTSAAALPLLRSGKVAGRELGSLAHDAVAGAAATRVETLAAAVDARALIPSRTVWFTQDSAGATFRDGRSIFELANRMAEDRRAPDGLPAIRLFINDGNIYSLDNRRLFAGQYANVDLPARWATASEISARRRSELFDGTSILIRQPGGRGNRGWWQP
ncbi:MAG: hypothetical protein JWR90_2510 [Marmoricola sp.]|jgi:hypothetical protein|nr:hypothetical protein [Marmoricola sp.]